MNIKESYNTCKRIGRLTAIVDKYQNLLDDDIADIVKVQADKQKKIEKKIESIFSLPFIEVSTYRNNNNRQVHKYAGPSYIAKFDTIEQKIKYFFSERKEDSIIFVNITQKKYDKFLDSADFRWFPNGSAMVLDDILAKNKLEDNYPITIMGPDIDTLVKRVGYANPKVFNFDDYIAVDVNGKAEKKVAARLAGRVDDEKLFGGIGKYDAERVYSANDILTDAKLKDAVIFIARNRDDYYSADLNVCKSSPTRYLHGFTDYLEKVFPNNKFLRINYGDWKRLQKGEAYKKLNTFIEFCKKQGKAYYEGLASKYKITKVEGRCGILSSSNTCEKIMNYWNDNASRLNLAATADEMERIKEFIKVVEGASKDNSSWEARDTLRKISYVAGIAGFSIGESVEEVIKIDTDKWPFLDMFSSYSSNIDAQVVLSLVATYKTI